MFIYNSWYAIAWQSELTGRNILPKLILNQPLVLYIDQTGKVHCLEDRCPHKQAPLSMGFVVDNTIQCRYHGLRFGPNGNCVYNPYSNHCPKHAKVKSYPIKCINGIVWVWMGDISKETPNPIELPPLDTSTNYIATDTISVNADYLLAIDNILDLSHLEYLHPTTLGSKTRNPVTIQLEINKNCISMTRTSNNEILNSFLCSAFQLSNNEYVDRKLVVHWHAPSLAIVKIIIKSLSKPGNNEKCINTFHLFTPDTDKSFKYMFAASISKSEPGYSNASLQIGLKALKHPFDEEDRKMLEAQQAHSKFDVPDTYKSISLPGDKASIHARKIIKRLWLEEKCLRDKS